MHGARKPHPRKTNHAVAKGEPCNLYGIHLDTFFGMLGEEPFTITRTFPVTAHELDMALDIGNENHWSDGYFMAS